MSMISSKIENKTLTFYAQGRIDSTNAPLFDSEICAECEKAKGEYENIVVDAENLAYISSAGLRVILKLRKNESSFKIINASADVYEIFEMTGFTEMIPVEKAYRRFCVDGCKIIGEGAKGTVYRYDTDTIVKVYKNPDSLPDIKNERELARRAFVLGIPTAISYDVVKVGESYGSVFELLDAKSYSQLIAEDPANRDKYISEYALLLCKIHETQVKAEDMPDMKIFVRDWLRVATPFISPESAEKLKKLIDETPDTLNMLHCDYHTNNVMSQNGETLLIDMDTLSHGYKIFELANVYITYVGFGEDDPTMVENFIKLPYETAKYIWKKFLPVYLGTEDPEKLREVENKARLISDVRLVRHTVRRGGDKTEDGMKIISRCREDIDKLLKDIDTLEI